MTTYRQTVRLTPHARLRAKEMGVLTKTIKRLVQEYEISRPAHSGRLHLEGGRLVLIYDPVDHSVVTVMPRTVERYVRPNQKGNGK